MPQLGTRSFGLCVAIWLVVLEHQVSIVKRELTHHESYADHPEAHCSLFDYVEIFYNRWRRHATLGYRSPTEFEKHLK